MARPSWDQETPLKNINTNESKGITTPAKTNKQTKTTQNTKKKQKVMTK